MSDNQNQLNKDEVKDGELLDEGHESYEIESIINLLKGVTEPLAKGQEVAEKEATKRAEIQAGVATKIIYGVILVAVLIVGLAAIALWKENSNLAEKLVIALLAFLGGLGAGKAASKVG
ncbi:MAG: hypothetical protein L3J84_14080 [Gammaproteobacteria bacterium]|nr:hypothetical protein [Gammaproteobacteria bacterium]